MSELMQVIKNGEQAQWDQAFATAAAEGNPARDAEMFEALEFLNSTRRSDAAEVLAWGWLTSLSKNRPLADAVAIGGRLLLLCPGSSQIRTDLADVYRAAHGERDDLAAWLDASGLTGEKVPPHRALRTLDLMLSINAGDWLVERILPGAEHPLRERVAEVVDISAASDAVTIRVTGGVEEERTSLRLADEWQRADENCYCLLARRDRERLVGLIGSDPLAVLVSAIRGAGGRIDQEQLRAALAPAFMPDSDWSKWWSRARNAAKRNPHIRIEGRMPAVLVYDEVGVTLEAETLDTLGKAKTPAARLGVVEGYLRTRGGAPDKEFLNEVARLATSWVAGKSQRFANALAAYRLNDLGVPVDETATELAIKHLADVEDAADLIRSLDDDSLWAVALDLLREAKPVAPGGPAHGDWQAIYLELLPKAPTACCDRIAAALLGAGQTERLNAEVLVIVESPVESIDALCWLWNRPADSDKMQLPSSGEILGQLLGLLRHALVLADTDSAQAKFIRGKVRSALSARGYGAFAAHLETIDAAMAEPLRRQLQRVEGIGSTVPERLLAMLNERHPPRRVVKTVPQWLEEDVIYCSPEALRGRERELEHIQNVEMPANAVAIGRAASYGDLSENSEYKYALEERDLLRARAARIANELAMARTIHPGEVPADHVAIYSRVQLQLAGDDQAKLIQIVSPWDSDVTAGRFNYKAPLSQQLLGKKPGERVTLSFDGGPEQQFTIAGVLPPQA
ncbi:MAG: Transcription elongation factor GreA [Phycisphaerae bacterium]|nr:Transcription elongation factor GreA [Phycisphaerae bacterium]